jgi:CubicO group peptidase (beta-lactamase class C family)
MHFFQHFILIVFLSNGIYSSYSQTKTQKIDALMTAYHQLEQFNGTVLVAEKGKVIYEKGFGFANMQWEIPNKPDTKFLLASVSKQFTAMLILQLVNKNLIRLDSKITDYLNYYPKETGSKITIHQLLTHTSGIPDITNFPDFDEKYAHKRFKTHELLALFDSLALEFEPGTDYNYSNSGYSVLAAIIEAVTHTSYKQVLKEFITTPLGMNNTGWADSKMIFSRYAYGYQWAALDKYIDAPYFDNSISLGAGGIYSTVTDMYKWDQALYTNTLVPDSLRIKMFTPYKNNYGYGFFISKWENPNTKDSLTFIEHGGANVGFNTLIFRSTKDKNLIIMLSNTNEAKLNFIRNRIRSILYNRPYDLPEKKLKNIVAEVLRNRGMDSAKAKYWELKRSKLEEYGNREFIYEFSQLGYSLVLSNHIDEAIEIYKLNTEAFPSSSKAFDDLGEAYLVKGNKELAIMYYSKAYELDKKNERIKYILNKLISQ